MAAAAAADSQACLRHQSGTERTASGGREGKERIRATGGRREAVSVQFTALTFTSVFFTQNLGVKTDSKKKKKKV